MNIKMEAMADEQTNDGNINDGRKSFDKKMVGYGSAISINTFDDGLVAWTTNIPFRPGVEPGISEVPSMCATFQTRRH